MSIKALNWAFSQELAASPKLTLLALADHADDDGICWPGVTGLAKKTSQSERTIQRRLVELQEAGYLRSEERIGRTNLYHLILPTEKDKC